ncbi:MAG: hypothetical protein H7067_16480, partial [Burkholderiales bacterium]|nr:hypothetical protein [Opitutaceae bacterium]
MLPGAHLATPRPPNTRRRPLRHLPPALPARRPARHLLDSRLRRRPPPPCTLPLRAIGHKRLLALPLNQQLTPESYESKRDKWLGKLNRLVRTAAHERRSIVWVFEGWDAAGKGGAIRRLTTAIDARDYRVIPVSKPTDEEKAHHYLWRFWRHLP